MKYCTNCGKELEDNAQFCTACGTPVPPSENAAPNQNSGVYYAAPDQGNNNGYPQNGYNNGYPNGYTPAPPVEDKASVGLIIVSVLFPLVGIILAIVNWKKKPAAAKKYLIAAIVAWVIAVILGVISGILGAGALTEFYY